MEVFGVTGTNGKTTVSYMIREILIAAGKSCDLIGTVCHSVGGRCYKADYTTPPAEVLERYFEEAGKAGTECCSMEISSHGLAGHRIDGIKIDHAGFTNLTRDHLDFHGDMESYYQAKKLLFKVCAETGVITVDDEYGRRLYKEVTEEAAEKAGAGKDSGLDKASIYSCSLKSRDADFFGQIEEMSVKGSKVSLYCRVENAGVAGSYGETDGDSIAAEKSVRKLGELEIPAAGRFFVYDALLAASMTLSAGVPFEAVRKGLKKGSRVPGRFETFHGAGGKTVIVDFAHTPDALENVLQAASQFKKRRLITVFGCGGDRDRGKRPQMGMIAGKYSDYVFITDDNPRSEEEGAIASEIEAGIRKTLCQYEILLDRREAIKKAIEAADEKDIVVVAGRGHEELQKFDGYQIPFDDRTVVSEILIKNT